MLKQKAFNYMVFILGIITIFMAISIEKNNSSRWPGVLMLCITLCFYFVSKKYNNEAIKLKKEDRELFDKIKEEKINKKNNNKNK